MSPFNMPKNVKTTYIHPPETTFLYFLYLVEVPVDGGWGPWSCATGTIERTCSDPPPANGGEPCEELVEGTDLTGGCQY